MPFVATVLTMFPEAFPGPLGVSLVGTSWREQGLWRLDTVDIFEPFQRISAASWTIPLRVVARGKSSRRWSPGRWTAWTGADARFCI